MMHDLAAICSLLCTVRAGQQGTALDEAGFEAVFDGQQLVKLQAMARDRKLNVMLLPPARLRKMIEAHDVFAGRAGVRCSFRAPKHHG